ncbi:DNA methyltransferase [candidate division Kazan bacterium RIFCSPHIGHO2_01_FULL_44_14]|uniref:site-specific DNA-methyltransferase (adenine-specific) n=1 Tax=candidate division Kazan bacterium RIFCSPLOWO2_01_FULL_45_19 TaxID=1798538 RepID=A0A1F4NQZ3_UNCK3|nr:MAG: DNA methyltransferase [candidate division Kazan bacterium RIFCSPLOWO2_01_FULL_45_19]OGB78128.1 MAG: DNA methyltransferase [candidate division Kazan bacterium RIFCSPHIGHO2_01_FULL_44_14]
MVQTFSIQNRRYLGSKYRLLSFIEEIVGKECKGYKTFCDIFAGTGVVGAKFNDGQTEIIANDILSSSIVCLKTFLMTDGDYRKSITHKIDYLNSLQTNEDNYFSMHFGNSYFSITNARKIGMIRSAIDEISKSEQEKSILLCSLLYAVDKIANTVGHYDAYRKSPDIDKQKPVTLLLPEIDWESNHNNRIYKEDANALVRKIKCDVLYIDPPYNSRQYSDAYHLLENLVDWGKPTVSGIAKKMDRSHIKSEYCLRGATEALEDLIQNANCKYILLSYNNTGESKNDRSNARISDNDIVRILKAKGEVKTFEKTYRAFTTGKSDINGHTERVFFCKVRTAKL